MKRILLLLMLFAGLTAFTPGNTRRITGTVYDRNDGQPIAGATVKIKGTNTGTQTSANGKYSVTVPEHDATLSVSYIGYETQEIPVGENDTIDVMMQPSSSQLAEVVVTSMSAQKQVVSRSYSTTVIQKNTAPVMTNGLTGKVSGLSVNRVASGVFATKKITLSCNPSANTTSDESYKSILENEFSSVKSNPLSTFSVDVDAASYCNVRRFINSGQLPPADAVRIEEMVNYFKYDITGPINDKPVAIHTELSSAPWNTKHRLLRIALKAKTIDGSKYPPSNIVFLIDVSGSMNEANKLPLVKSAMKLLVSQLRAQDKVAIVTYAGQAGITLDATPGNKKKVIMDAIDGLNAEGSTAGGEGIKMAYRIAKQNFIKNGNNRTVMGTDGDFNVGPSSDEDMEQLVVKERDSKVAISIMGFGMGNLKDSKMETLADKGNGNYAYIDNITEARKFLVSEFGGTLFTVAKDVKLQIEFNPAKVQAYRLLGYEDRILNKEDFNNDKKDAGDMGSGHTVTALYEIVPTGIKDDYAGSVDPLKYQKTAPVPVGNSSDEMMTIKFRYKVNDAAVSKMDLTTVKDMPLDLKSTTADFRFAAAVAEFGMLLRNSQFKYKSNYSQVINLANAAKGADHDGYRAEFVRLAESAKLLSETMAQTD